MEFFGPRRPPNQLGQFVAFDVNNFTNELPDKTIPADVFLTSGDYEKARQSQQCLADGERALKNKNAKSALDLADRAESFNPGFYRNAFLSGRALLALNRKNEAARMFELALSEQPAFLKEKQQLEDLLREAGNTN
jgi:hypothetical protein